MSNRELSERWGFTVFDADSVAGPPAEHDRWTHIAFTWDRQHCRFFVDGIEYTNDGMASRSRYFCRSGKVLSRLQPMDVDDVPLAEKSLMSSFTQKR